MSKIKKKQLSLQRKGRVGLSQSANNSISIDKIYLSFCLHWLDLKRKHITDEDKLALVSTMSKLSSLSWKEIRSSGRHQCGYEKIPIKSLRGVTLPPEIFTEDVERVDVFRYSGKKAMIGLLLRAGEFVVYHIIHLDTNFRAYRH